MATGLDVALARLGAALRAHGAPVTASLRPGLEAADIRRALAAENLHAHEDVVAWWEWHDGAGADVPVAEGPGMYFRGENTLVGPWHMPTLADALRTRRFYLDQAARAGDDLPPPSWLPIAMTDGAGELCADTAASGPAPLYILDPETLWERDKPRASSLAEFARLLARAVEEGLVMPHPHDARAPQLDFPRLPAELRRLASG